MNSRRSLTQFIYALTLMYASIGVFIEPASAHVAPIGGAELKAKGSEVATTEYIRVGWTPRVRQTVKTLFTVR